MKRRDLVAAAVGVACVPSVLLAQPASRSVRIGWVDASSAAENLGVFVEAMHARGWKEGKTFRMAYRGGDGRPERLTAVTNELVSLPATVIVAPGTAETVVARRATSSIPIVMIGVDEPVERGLVATLARPGGNVTGLASTGRELNGKLLSIIRELMPQATNVAFLGDATNPDYPSLLRQLKDAARTLGLTLSAAPVWRHTEVEPAIAAFKRQGIHIVVIPDSNLLIPRWVVELAQKAGLPVASTSPAVVYEGGLVAYSDDWNAVFDRAANYADRILKGASPAGLAVETPSTFKLVVNMKTAQGFGLQVPQVVRYQAHAIING